MNKQELIEFLVCPKCKGSLTDVPDGFACSHCELLYPIRDDIPIMLIEQALPLSEQQIASKD